MNAVDDLQHSPGHTARGQSSFMVSSARHDHMSLTQTATGARALASEATGAFPVVWLDYELILTSMLASLPSLDGSSDGTPFAVPVFDPIARAAPGQWILLNR